jgi:methionine sulfoxide reductase heme-binding subunit
MGPMDLGADPVREIIHTCGKTALNLLLITLSVTPVRELTKLSNLLRLRRMLGLFVLFYIVLHFVAYGWLDQSLDFAAIGEDILERPYITIGMLGLLLLIPLGITSTNAMMRRLGKRWLTLHKLVYIIAALGLWHFYWQVKKDIREPLIYIATFAALMAYRVFRKPVRAWLKARSAPATVPERT